MTTDPSTTSPRKCPSDEFLVAALTDRINDDDRQWLDTHLDVCDRCLDTVSVGLRRLHIADEIPAAVPVALRQRAAAAALEPAAAILPGLRPASQQAAARRATENRHMLGRTLGSGLSAVRYALRPRLLIPALASAAVLVVAMQTWMTSDTPRPMTRSIAMPTHVRVTAVEAAVRRRPSGHAEVVATVTRGTVVEIRGEERDWSHVTLPDGTEGWVDQGALR